MAFGCTNAELFVTTYAPTVPLPVPKIASEPSAQFWFPLPFHQWLDAVQLPFPSDGFGEVEPFASQVNVAAWVREMVLMQATTYKARRPASAKGLNGIDGERDEHCKTIIQVTLCVTSPKMGRSTGPDKSKEHWSPASPALGQSCAAGTG